jgi:hypothetical protein
MNSKEIFSKLKTSCLFIVMLTSGYNTYGQFISSVTIPDTTIPKIISLSDPQVKNAQSITVEDMRRHLTKLTSTEFEGRETGQPGNNKAADYISNHFKNIGLVELPNTQNYKQEVIFSFAKWDKINLKIGNKEYIHNTDFTGFAINNPVGEKFTSDDIVFLGYGIDDAKYSDYNGNTKCVKNKVILINEGEPILNDGSFKLSGNSNPSNWTLDKKLKAAKDNGVKMVLIIADNFLKTKDASMRSAMSRGMKLGKSGIENSVSHVFINTNMAKEIFGKNADKIIKAREGILLKNKLKAVELDQAVEAEIIPTHSALQSQNVIGLIKGSEKPDEVIIVSAHYDHLGKRGESIYYGADDNGSGTTTIMELAEAYAKAASNGNRPKRSIAFLLVTGEEKGLLGSEYYSNFPLMPLANTVANVNVDMVGRVDDKYKNNPNYIYVIGSDRLSTELHEINEEANKKYAQLTLDYTYNDENDPNRYYFRSDHYNFAVKGIPAIFFFNGVHADYHQTTDTVEKIEFNKMEKIGRLVFHTIWELANREKRIVVNVK